MILSLNLITRNQSSGSRKQSSGARNQPLGSRKQSSGTRNQPSGSRKQSSGTRNQPSGATVISTIKPNNRYKKDITI